MKAAELADLSIDELTAKTGDLRHELLNARVKKSTGQLENTAKLQSLRRDIARVETLLHARHGAVK